jgi:hypothetical protein
MILAFDMANHDDRNHYQRSPDSSINEVLNQHKSGAEGIRTPDPLIANEVRYQLRYSPQKDVREAITSRGRG